jgi:hypothetical protein
MDERLVGWEIERRENRAFGIPVFFFDIRDPGGRTIASSRAFFREEDRDGIADAMQSAFFVVTTKGG